MKDFSKKEYKLLLRFDEFLSTNSVAEIKKLHRDIRIFFGKSGKEGGVLSYVSLMLEIYSVETKNEDLADVFDYNSKMSKTYKIADNIMAKLRELSEGEIDFHYLLLSQVILPHVRDIEEAEKLCQKSLRILRNLVEDKNIYVKNKFSFHMNMIDRTLKAEFFEVDHEKNKDLSKRVKELYDYHIKEALECLEQTEEIGKEKEFWLQARIGIMERDSEKITKCLDEIPKLTGSKIFNDLVREEVSYYSFDILFNLTQGHFNAALGIRIRKLRERIGLPVESFAYKLGYEDRQMIRSIERGYITLSVYQLSKIADYFGVTTEELFYGQKGRRAVALRKEEFDEYFI